MNDQATHRTASAAKQPLSYSLPSGERVPVLFRLQNLQRPGGRLSAAASAAPQSVVASELPSADSELHAVGSPAEPIGSSSPLPPVLEVTGPSWMRRNAYRLTVLGLLGVTGPLLLSNHLRSNTSRPTAAAKTPAAAPEQALVVAPTAAVEMLDFEGSDGPRPTVAATRPVEEEPLFFEPVLIEPVRVEPPSLASSALQISASDDAAEPDALTLASPELLAPKPADFSEPSPSDFFAGPAEREGSAASQAPVPAEVSLDSPWRPAKIVPSATASDASMRLTSAAKPETPSASTASAASAGLAIPHTAVPDMEDPRALLRFLQRNQPQTPEQAVQESRRPAAAPASAGLSQTVPQQPTSASGYVPTTAYPNSAAYGPGTPGQYIPSQTTYSQTTYSQPAPGPANYGQSPAGQFPHEQYAPAAAPPQNGPAQGVPPQQIASAPQGSSLYATATDPQGNAYSPAAASQPAKSAPYQPLFPEFGGQTAAVPPTASQQTAYQPQTQQPLPAQEPQRQVYQGSTADSLYRNQPNHGGQQPTWPTQQPAASLSSQPAPAGYGFTR